MWLVEKIRQVRPHGRALSLSGLNQAVSSGSNFLMGLVLVRILSTEQFGLYGIAFAAILFFSGLSNALFTVQMVVAYPSREAALREHFAATMLVLVAATGAAFILLSLLMEPIAPGEWKWLTVAVGGGAAMCALKDFFVRHAYSQRREVRALLINCTVAAVLIVGLLWMKMSSSMHAVVAVSMLAGAYAAGAMIGAANAGLPLRDVRAAHLGDELRYSWRGGKWAFSGAVVVWLQSQVHVYVSAIVLGPAGVAMANAARLFISPFLFMSPAINQLALPRFASLTANDPTRLTGIAKFFAKTMVLLATTYLVALAFAYPLVRELFLGGRYAGIEWCVAAWGAVLVAQVFRESASTPLQALREFKLILTRNIISVVIALGLAVALASRLGVVGPVVSLAVGEFVFACLLWRSLTKLSRSSLPG